MQPVLQLTVALVANLPALMMEIGAAVLLTLLIVVLRRQVRTRAHFRLWERAWGVLVLAMVMLLLRQLADVPPLMTLMLYQAGKIVFFALLLLGALAYAHPGVPLPIGPASAAAAFVGVITAWSDGANAPVLWQALIATVLCGVAGWQLLTMPGERRTFGTRVTGGAILAHAVTWAFYGVHLGAPESAVGGALAPLMRQRLFIDTLVLGGLGFGVVLLLMEESLRAMKESEERLRTLITSTTDTLLLLDRELRVTTANPSAARLFDVSEASLAGRDMLSLLEVDNGDNLRVAMQHFAAEHGTEFRLGETESVLARRGAGAPVRVEGSLWRLPGDRRELAAIFRDVTAREELRARQARQSKTDAVRQLAAGIAHDFNNLLTTISTRSQLLLLELGSDDRVRDTVAEITRSTTSAARLARDLLAMSGRQSLQPMLLDVNAAVRRLERAIRDRLPSNVSADFRYAVDAGRVRVDDVRFGEALLVIAQNAGESMAAQGGRILVATARGIRATEARAAGVDESAEYAYVSVHDTGSGLSVEARSHLFEPFYSTKGEGRGLGLPTALGFAQQSGGWLAVQSSPAGTIVRLGFPVALDATNGEIPNQGHAATPTGGTIRQRCALLAEDDEVVRRVVHMVLSREGYDVIEGTNGVTALEAWSAKGRPLDVLVADVEMPRMGGPELAARVLQRQPGTRIILMSGYVADDALRAAVPAADVRFLQKPFDVDALVRVLRDGLPPA